VGVTAGSKPARFIPVLVAVAGLTPLSISRFAVATLAGIIPASFLLAHFGGEMASDNVQWVMLAVLVLGTVTLVPVLIKLAIDRRRWASQGASGKER
tara:strand:+ start:4973 stop:5263 length:291 start_codon:yes stop_codon:yes gene_type:complete